MQEEILGGGYPPPGDRLLTLGDPRELRELPVDPGNSLGWLDYRRLGLGPDEVPDLIRLATDTSHNRSGSDSAAVWARRHAMRALGQLRAEAAIEPLLRVLTDDGDDDWVHEELPDVFGLIGPAAIPALTAYLAGASHELFRRVTAAISLDRIGVTHSEARADCVAALTQHIDQQDGHDAVLNAFIISALIELRAMEAAPRIKAAFERGVVDVSVIGDWDSVRLALGLWPSPLMRITQPRPPSDVAIESLLTRSPLGTPSTPSTPSAAGAPLASGRRDKTGKAARTSRKRNKKRK